MFVPISRPFSEIASDLYLPRSFETPPPALSQPPGDPAWAYYGSEGAEAAPPFGEFMRGEVFKRAQQQMLEGVRHCEAFARTCFSTEEVEAISKGFEAFREKLLLDDGLRLIGIDRLPVLYGIGKQSFDNFRMLLDHPGIELHLRKSALRELASQVGTCMSTGPAFTYALMQLQRPDGTLRGQYWRVLQQVMDETLRQFVREVWEQRKGESIADMETHLVNRFRLELGLPGALRNDLLSEGASLVSSAEVQACAEVLLRDCRPATVALELAGLYRERLEEITSETLGMPSSRIDLNNDLHMHMLRAAAARLAPTFPGTSLRSLVQEDPDAGAFGWRRDDTLVARDLLLELARQGYVQPPVVGTLMRSTSTDNAWAIRHIDDRLVYLQAYPPRGAATGEVDSVGMEHLLRMLPLRPSQAVARMVTTVVEAESPQALLGFPVEALGSIPRTALLLRRLGPELATEWVRTQPLTDMAVRLLLRAATMAQHAGVLTKVFQGRADVRPMSFITFAGGPDILALALAAGETETSLAWIGICRRALLEMPSSTAAALLENARGVPLLHAAVLRSPAPVLQALVDLVAEARDRGKLKSGDYVRHIHTPIDEVMRLDRLACLEIIGRHAMDAARSGWLLPSEVAVVLEGEQVGRGCLGAAIAGSVQGVQWFQSTVIKMAHEGRLHKLRAGAMLCGTWAGPSAQMEAADVGDPELLDAVLHGVVVAAHHGWVSERRLTEALSLPGDGSLSGLARIFLREDGRCARLWTRVLLELCEQGALRQERVAQLLRGPVVTDSRWLQVVPALVGAPLPVFLSLLREIDQGDEEFLSPDERLSAWGDAIATLAEAGALLHDQVFDLLAARHQGRPALLVAMSQGRAFTMVALMNVCFMAREKALISELELVRLLDVWPEGVSVLTWPPRADIANDFVQVLKCKAAEGALSEMACVGLITPYLRADNEPPQEARFRAMGATRKAMFSSRQPQLPRRGSI